MKDKEIEKGKKIDNLLNLGLIVLILLLSMSLFRKLGNVGKVNQKIMEENKELEEIREETKELEKRLSEVQSETHIEKQLRDKLGMAKEGEIVVVLPDDEFLRSLVPDEETEEDKLPDPNWRKWLELFM